MKTAILHQLKHSGLQGSADSNELEEVSFVFLDFVCSHVLSARNQLPGRIDSGGRSVANDYLLQMIHVLALQA